MLGLDLHVRYDRSDCLALRPWFGPLRREIEDAAEDIRGVISSRSGAFPLETLYFVAASAGKGGRGEGKRIQALSFIRVQENPGHLLHLFSAARETGPKILVLRILPDFRKGFLKNVPEPYFLHTEFLPVKDPQKGGRNGGAEIDARRNVSVYRDIQVL